MLLRTPKSTWVSLIMAIVVLCCVSGTACAYSLWWKNLLSSSAGWNDAANWNSSFPDPDYPNDIGATAIFPAWTNTGHGIRVQLATPITVANITRYTQNTDENVTFAGSPLIFSGYGGNSRITVNHANDDLDTTFECKLILSNNLEVLCTSIGDDRDNRVHFENSISGPSAGIIARSTGPSRSYVTIQTSGSTYGGGLTLSNIVLELANANGLGTGDVTAHDGVSIEFEGNITAANDMSFSSSTILAQDTVAFVTLNGVLSGPGNLTLQTVSTPGNGASGNPITLAGSNPNTCSGNFTLTRETMGEFAGDIVASKDRAFGTAGSITIDSNVWLTVTDSGGADDRLPDGASLYLQSSGATAAKIQLSPGVSESVGRIYFDGVPQRPGTWGSSSSPAANKDDTWFTGFGILQVLDTGLPKKGTLLLIR